MPISAPLLRPLGTAAVADEVAGGGVDDVEEGENVEDAEEEDEEDVVCFAFADEIWALTDWAAPMKLLRGLVVEASWARVLPTLVRATRAGRRTFFCIVEDVVGREGKR